MRIRFSENWSPTVVTEKIGALPSTARLGFEVVPNELLGGERGRNRTFNLLIVQQSAKCLLFQRLLDFENGQKWAVLGVFVMRFVIKLDH